MRSTWPLKKEASVSSPWTQGETCGAGPGGADPGRGRPKAHPPCPALRAQLHPAQPAPIPFPIGPQACPSCRRGYRAKLKFLRAPARVRPHSRAGRAAPARPAPRAAGTGESSAPTLQPGRRDGLRWTPAPHRRGHGQAGRKSQPVCTGNFSWAELVPSACQAGPTHCPCVPGSGL